MNVSLFELLTIHFRSIYSTKKKQAFLKQIGQYLAQDKEITITNNLITRNHATCLMVVTYPTPEKLMFGKQRQTLKGRQKYLISITISKIIALLLSVCLFIGAFILFKNGEGMMATLSLGLAVIGYFYSQGLPKKTNFTHMATLTSVIESFQKNPQADLLFLDKELFTLEALNTEKEYQQILYFKNLYSGADLYKMQREVNHVELTLYVSGEKNKEGQVSIVNDNLSLDNQVPNTISTSLAEIDQKSIQIEK
jgi:uncharacterized protein (DUF2141 family)